MFSGLESIFAIGKWCERDEMCRKNNAINNPNTHGNTNSDMNEFAIRKLYLLAHYTQLQFYFVCWLTPWNLIQSSECDGVVWQLQNGGFSRQKSTHTAAYPTKKNMMRQRDASATHAVTRCLRSQLLTTTLHYAMYSCVCAFTAYISRVEVLFLYSTLDS